MPKTIVERIREYASFSPSAVMIRAGEESFTYAEFYRYSRRAAEFLRLLGVGTGDAVLCRACQNVAFVALYVACLSSGALFVPFGKDYSTESVRELIGEFSPEVLFGNETDEKNVLGTLCRGYRLNDLSSLCSSFDEMEMISRPSDSDAFILFTGGSTGKPKASLIPLIRTMQGDSFARVLGYDEGTKLYLFAPVDHMAFYALSSAVFAVGGTLILSQGMIDARDLVRAFTAQNANALHATPSVMRFWMNRFGDLFHEVESGLKVFSLAGEKVPPALQKEIAEEFPLVRSFTLYGSTEAGVVSYYCFSENGAKDGCVGVPMEDVRYECDDGRVMIFSPYRMKNYVGEQRISCVATDDRGEIAQGKLYILGRISDIVVSGGMKIDPLEVEHAVAEYPFVRECVCGSKKDDILGNVCVLYVVWENEEKTEDLRRFLWDKLEGYKVPREIRAVTQIQKMASGKTDRKFYREK